MYLEPVPCNKRSHGNKKPYYLIMQQRVALTHCSQRKPTCSNEDLLLLLLSCFSRVRLFSTPWTVAYPAPPSMGFSRQESWSGVPLPSPRQSGVWADCFFFCYCYWLHWVFIALRGLSLVAVHRSLLLQSTGSRCVGLSICSLLAL